MPGPCHGARGPPSSSSVICQYRACVPGRVTVDLCLSARFLLSGSPGHTQAATLLGQAWCTRRRPGDAASPPSRGSGSELASAVPLKSEHDSATP
eukprot:161124-Rhodomonas_salina.1